MNSTQWKRKTASWRVYRRPGKPYEAPPTEQDLDAFEQHFSFQLPLSYRAFALLMGPGTVSGFCTIATPGCKSEQSDLNSLNRSKQKNWKKIAELLDRRMTPEGLEQLGRLITMAVAPDGIDFGWDPKDISPEGGHEQGIYLVRRTPEGHVEKVAATFDEFILDFCMGPRYFDFFPYDPKTPDDPDYPFSEPRESYDPVPLKKRPKRK
ncbi:MAG: SMI1/KNR4 family protein [Planctomycetaceae bacterium]|nr:SMI1/KNR4 family protein [Planctomycetaceae bacterium]